MKFSVSGVPNGGIKKFIPPKMSRIVPQRDSFLADIIGYDRLKLYFKIYAP